MTACSKSDKPVKKALQMDTVAAIDLASNITQPILIPHIYNVNKIGAEVWVMTQVDNGSLMWVTNKVFISQEIGNPNVFGHYHKFRILEDTDHMRTPCENAKLDSAINTIYNNHHSEKDLEAAHEYLMARADKLNIED